MAYMRRFVSCVVALAFAFPLPSGAFDMPLSGTAVREAYFMGQRHDQAYGEFLDSYYKHLPAPEKGPYVSYVAFLTPYALLAQFSNQHAYGYNAQQAEIDHQNTVETVQVLVEIQLTNTYGPMMDNPLGRTSGTPWSRIPRPPDFWRDFRIEVTSDGKALTPLTYTGDPEYLCGQSDMETIAVGEYCTLTGATVQLEFPADSFTGDSAKIQVVPPGGAPVVVDFDLYSMK
jgi:hypothetical protein